VLSLNDAEMDAVMALAQALGGEVGAGTVYRVGSRLQRQFLRTVSGAAE
jgi:hypothetical protein